MISFTGPKDDANIEAHGLTCIHCIKQVLEYGNAIFQDSLDDLEKLGWVYQR